MYKRIVVTILAAALMCSLTVGVQALGPAGISLKDGSVELLNFDAGVYQYAVQPDTWTTALSLTVDDENAVVYSNAGTGVVGKSGSYTVNLAPIGCTTGITIITEGKTYFISSKHKPIEASASVTAFGFSKADNPSLVTDAVGVIDAEKRVITVLLAGSDLTALKANFTHTGVSLRVNGLDQTSGQSSQNFAKKNRLTYYLVADDGLDAIYMVNLVEIDKSSLGQAIEVFEGLTESHWKSSLWANVSAAYEEALVVYLDPFAIQDEVDAAAEALCLALDALLPPWIAPASGQAPSFVIRKNMITQIKIDTNLNAANLTFTSSNTNIATVTQTGVVTGKSIGVAVVQVKDTATGYIFNFVVNCTN